MQANHPHIFRRCATCRIWHQQDQLQPFHMDALRTPSWMPIRIKIHSHDRFLYLCKDCVVAKGQPKKKGLSLIPGVRADLDVVGSKGTSARRLQQSSLRSTTPAFICRLCGHQAAHFSHLELHMKEAHEGAAVDELAEAMDVRVRLRQDAKSRGRRKQAKLSPSQARWQKWNAENPIPSGGFSPR